MPPPVLRRIASLALLLSALSLPVAAQPGSEPPPNLGHLVSVLWERLEASLLFLWETGGPQIPPPTENTTDDGDGRIHIDPDG